MTPSIQFDADERVSDLFTLRWGRIAETGERVRRKTARTAEAQRLVAGALDGDRVRVRRQRDELVVTGRVRGAARALRGADRGDFRSDDRASGLRIRNRSRDAARGAGQNPCSLDQHDEQSENGDYGAHHRCAQYSAFSVLCKGTRGGTRGAAGFGLRFP